MTTKSKSDTIARGLLIEQTRKELLDDLEQYVAGKFIDGTFFASKDGRLDGYLIILPDAKYKELFEGKESLKMPFSLSTRSGSVRRQKGRKST